MTGDTGDAPWWAEGLRFACTRCGACCRGGGLVELTDADIARMAAFLGVAEADFRARYTRRLRRGRIALVEREFGACVFLDSTSARQGCRVHAVRPAQCSSYPFWAEVVATPSAWRDEGTRCPGIGAGPLRAAAEIRAGLRAEADPDGAWD